MTHSAAPASTAKALRMLSSPMGYLADGGKTSVDGCALYCFSTTTS